MVKRKDNEQKFGVINTDAAGIDIGSREHYVCVPTDRDSKNIRTFGAFTQDLKEMVAWLKQCSIKTIAMESTGVYWIPLFQILETSGFEVKLVNARHVKNVPGRKTDVEDCQWLQRLHSYACSTAHSARKTKYVYYVVIQDKEIGSSKVAKHM